MKPSWENAPEWAKYLAMDEDGIWYWYAGEPYVDRVSRCWNCGSSICRVASSATSSWEDTLEERTSA